jgi:hypothetical protein
MLNSAVKDSALTVSAYRTLNWYSSFLRACSTPFSYFSRICRPRPSRSFWYFSRYEVCVSSRCFSNFSAQSSSSAAFFSRHFSSISSTMLSSLLWYSVSRSFNSASRSSWDFLVIFSSWEKNSISKVYWPVSLIVQQMVVNLQLSEWKINVNSFHFM